MGRISSIDNRTDHNGKVFDTICDMCKYWNIEYDTYRYRIKNLKWSKKDALTKEVNLINVSKEERTDHLGKIFNSIRDMCNYWNINYNTYITRIRVGWSKEKALSNK